jgi:steroid delta-isomerase-like uncharacterized protein
MATQDNMQLVRSFYEYFNSRDWNRVLSLFASNAEFKTFAFDRVSRGDEIREILEGWTRTFPDLKVSPNNIISAGDWIVVEATGRGTHKGAFETPDGSIAPTGKVVEAHSADIFKVVNGKISLVNCYVETGSMLRQMGFTARKAAA